MSQEKEYPLECINQLLDVTFIGCGKLRMADGSEVLPVIGQDGIYFPVPNGPIVSLADIVSTIAVTEYLKEPVIKESSLFSTLMGDNPHTVKLLGGNSTDYFSYRVNSRKSSFIMEIQEELKLPVHRRTYSEDEFLKAIDGKVYVQYGKEVTLILSSGLKRLLRYQYEGTNYSNAVEIIAHADSERVIHNVKYDGPYKVLAHILHFDATGTYTRDL